MILLLPLAGAIAWLSIGRPLAVVPATRTQPEKDRSRSSDSGNPAEGAADFTERARQRAEEQRRRYEQQKKKGLDSPRQSEPDRCALLGDSADQPRGGSTDQPRGGSGKNIEVRAAYSG